MLFIILITFDKLNSPYFYGIISHNGIDNLISILYIHQMQSTIRYIFVLILICLIQLVVAQDGIIRGHVYDENSGEPILYGTVLIEELGIGATTDDNGFYSINELSAGQYTLKVSYLGYSDQSIEVSIRENGIVYQVFNLSSEGVQLGVVDISAATEQAKTEVQISQLQVTSKQIKALPSTGGEPDLLQYLQVLPGVVTTGDQGGQIFIRGGSPVQNLITLDGMTVYNPFHSIGFFSIFETEIIRSADVMTGGFNAEYGGRISAVVDIKTRQGNKKQLGGQISASPFMLKALVEGPLFKGKKEGTGASFILTGKRSIIDQTSKTLYSYATDGDQGLPFDFTDLYGKTSFFTSNGSKFDFFGFNFNDEFFNSEIANINWSNFGLGSNFTILPPSSSLIINGKFGFSSYTTEISESEDKPRMSGIDEYYLGLDFNYFANTFEFDYGVELKSIRTDFNFTNQFDVNLSQIQNSTELSAFLKFRKSWKKFIIEPSLRFQYYAAVSEPSLEPRLGLKWNITDKFRFKAAGGVYSQNLLATNNERDVINLFNGFLSGPQSEITTLDGTPSDSRLQFANHAVAGFEIDLTPGLTLNVEGYLKDFTQLIVVNRNKISRDEANFVTETGDAYGIDLSLKYTSPKWYLWGAYSYGFANRYDGEQEYPTLFDRRHNLNVLGTYTLDKEGDFTASLRYNFGSGFPFTLAQGFYEAVVFDDGVDTDILSSNNDQISIIYDEQRNGGRLPNYHRIDASLTKKWIVSDWAELETVLSITNVANRNNIFYFDRLRYTRVDQLPIIPSLGVKVKF